MADKDELVEPKDDARPFFNRQTGEIGIYLDAYDATPINPHEWGSHHFFMVNVMEKLLDHVTSLDMFAIKGGLEKKAVLRQIVLERFEKGIVLAATCDTLEALEKLWKLHQAEKLSAIFQDILVTSATLKSCKAKNMRLRAKLWEDEYLPCKRETLSRPKELVSIESKERDLQMIKHVRQYQRAKLSQHVLQLRDDESILEKNLGEFVLSMKTTIPSSTTAIHTLKEFIRLVREAKKKKDANVALFDTYLAAIERVRSLFEEVQKNISHPLALVRGTCEKEKQRRLKEHMRICVVEMRQNLRLDNNLLKVKHAEWMSKILPREQELFLGAVSLIPMALEKIIDIDHNVDEYISDYAINIQ